MWRIVIKFLIGNILLLTVMAIYNTIPQTSAAAPRVIDIIADKDNTFKVIGSKKPMITAKPGEVLKLKITARKAQEADSDDGAVHSFTIKDLADQGWGIRLYEGTKTYTFVAPDKPGEYAFECTVMCGDGHEDMVGKLIIKE